ncbi:MAG TPA: sigma 54-interacting transcriptional regulator [Solimonas sp.]|nr:sigma 54-interacting transcriptional regulator [Solimonas sp.]
MFKMGWLRNGAEDTPQRAALPPPFLTVYAPELRLRDPDLLETLPRLLPEGCRYALEAPPLPVAPVEGAAPVVASSEFALALFLEPEQLDSLADRVMAAHGKGQPASLIVAVQPRQLVHLGRWLQRRGEQDRLSGLRLILARDSEDALRQLPGRLQHGATHNCIRMPVAAEVENTAWRCFYTFSPELQALTTRIQAYADNGIHRVYLLGGPGSGKTSLAYYYYRVRNRGRFVSVNLASENTGDKAAVKSLLCGHVSGAFPGAGARHGAFTTARDGVCFLDESHGVMGAVMEVLMEALDNGQYLPLGASAKQPVDCAILFASNRTWASLQEAVHIDEFTRLGAAVLEVPELHRREEDMIAVTATTLSRLAQRCTTWVAPQGVDEAGWKLIRECRWHGNVRALVRVLESAFVDVAAGGEGALLIPPAAIERGLSLWEPVTHHSHRLYAAH